MKKRTYIKPELKTIQIDNQISMVMMSPAGDPETNNQIKESVTNPYKISKA
jgi:hypothetical protein